LKATGSRQPRVIPCLIKLPRDVMQLVYKNRDMLSIYVYDLI